MSEVTWMRALGNRRRNRAVLLLAVAVVVVGSSALWHRDNAGGTAVVPHRMHLSGRVRGLFPGASKQMRVIVRNPTLVRIVLMRVRARAQDVPGCPGSYVRIRPYRGTRPVPPRGRIVIRMRVRLSPVTPDTCQRARLPIRFRARGMVA
jgi:hypothetical protein